MSETTPRFVDCHLHCALENFEAFHATFAEIGLCGAWNIRRVSPDRATEREFLDLLELTEKLAPGDVHTFYWPDWQQVSDRTFPKRCAAKIEEYHKTGIAGVKVWKNMGLGLKDPQGRLMMLDDERLNPIWEKLVELKLILIAHVADPANFWLPMDRSNPAYETLKARPEWHFGKPGLPSREKLFEARNRLHRRFKDLVIVNCHCGGYAQSLEQLCGWMDEMPNFHASIGARHIREEGEVVGAFLERHGDRITFETDLGMRKGRRPDFAWNREMYAKAIGRLVNLFGPFGGDVLARFARRNAERLIRGVREA